MSAKFLVDVEGKRAIRRKLAQGFPPDKAIHLSGAGVDAADLPTRGEIELCSRRRLAMLTTRHGTEESFRGRFLARAA